MHERSMPSRSSVVWKWVVGPEQKADELWAKLTDGGGSVKGPFAAPGRGQ
jgi:hypothetical protein